MIILSQSVSIKPRYQGSRADCKPSHGHLHSTCEYFYYAVDAMLTLNSKKAEDADVCRGAIALEGPILAHDLRQMTIGTRTSELFCLTVFGLCQWPAVEPYTVSMSAKPAKSRPAP